MGDLDQRLGALAQVPPEEVRDAELGDDIVHVSARGHHPGPLLQEVDDARHLAVLGGRREGDDRAAALRLSGAANEVDLPAEAREDLGTDRVRADLAGEVHLERRVDGHDVLVLADSKRIVHVLDGVAFEHRIVVQVIVQPVRAEGEGEDGLPHVHRLLAAGDDAPFDRLHDAV